MPGRRLTRTRSAASTSARPTRSLYNHASQVVIAHHDDKTVLSLMNDYQGEPSEFALVVPVPVVLQKGQMHIGDRELFQKIDATARRAWSSITIRARACRCARCRAHMGAAAAGMASARARCANRRREGARRDSRGAIHRRRIRHRDFVGQAIRRAANLAAAERLQDSARPRGRALEPYIRRDMKFFVAQGESERASAHRAQLPAAAAVRLRIAQVHAADSARDD